MDPDLHWSVYFNPTLQPKASGAPGPGRSGNNSVTDETNDSRVVIDHITNPESYALICSQLRMATEKSAADLARTTMKKLMDRLLNRANSRGSFETFLVAIILVNCAERMTWLFQTWEVEDKLEKVGCSIPTTNYRPL